MSSQDSERRFRISLAFLLLLEKRTQKMQSINPSIHPSIAWRGSGTGSVFLGRWTPESVGDYASGTNHVLPTYGYARMYSGVSLDTFQKKITVQSLSEQGIRNLGPSVAIMADVEGNSNLA